MNKRGKIFGVILAGGRSSRMGELDKTLLKLGERSIIEWVIAGARPQVEALFLSVKQNTDRYQHLQLSQISDYTDAVAGPLVGIVSAMAHIQQQHDIDAADVLACFPADTPWFPGDLVARLLAQMQETDCDVAVVRHQQQLQPLFSLWRLSLLQALEQAIRDGVPGPKLVLPRLRSTELQIADADARNFLNLNTPEQLDHARTLL